MSYDFNIQRRIYPDSLNRERLGARDTIIALSRAVERNVDKVLYECNENGRMTFSSDLERLCNRLLTEIDYFLD